MAEAPGSRRGWGGGAGSGEEPPPSPLPWRLGGAALGGSNGGGGASRSRPVSLRGRPRPFHFRRCLGVNIRVSAPPPRPFAAAPPISARLAGYRQVWSAAREGGGAGSAVLRAPRGGGAERREVGLRGAATTNPSAGLATAANQRRRAGRGAGPAGGRAGGSAPAARPRLLGGLLLSRSPDTF